VNVQISGGVPSTVGITSGAAQQLSVRSPWPGQSVTVVDGQTRATVVGATTSATFTIPTPLIANATSIGIAQPFEMANLGGGNVSLRARVNNLLVAADNAGAGPLIAKNTAVGPWETFQLINNPNGTVSFRAQVNNMLVCAENAGAAPLIANRTAIGQWEQFDLINN
jgi:hypothetical protein